MEYQDDYIKWCVSDEAHGPRFARSIDHFLKRLPQCTAVVCCNYMIYQMARQVLDRQGKRVPQDCSLVCFDCSNGDREEQGVTCSVHRGCLIGQEAASRLLRMIRSRDCGDLGCTYVLAPEIYPGRTAGPARRA